MGRLLAYLSASSGNTYPAIDTLLELERRGHELHVRVRASDVELMGALGLHAAAIDPGIEQIEIEDWRGRNQVDSLLRLIRGYYAWAELEIPDLRGAIAELTPDALIVDSNCLGAMYVAEASGLPWALYCPYPPAFRSDDVPPHGLGFRPARGPLGRARDRTWRAIGDRLVSGELRRFNELRAGLGLPPLRKFDDQFLQSDRFIAFTAEPYEYPRSDWPRQVRLVGPGLWEPPAEPPAWLGEETRPIVLVTASTAFQLDAKLITTALDALAGENLAVVATTAAHDPAQFHPPANARVEQFLPHIPFLARATCVVCHGGQGITQKALAAGVPVCVVPFSRDQFDVARRVQINDAGVRLHHKRLNPERLRAAVRTAITKRAGARRVARAFANAGGAPAAATAIEELLTTPPQQPAAQRPRARARMGDHLLVPSSTYGDSTDLDAVLGEYHAALDAFFRGDPNPVKPLYSRGDDATLANPFGPPRRGWAEVEETMDRAAANYRDGRALGFEEVSRLVTPELAYLVEVERYEAKVAASAETTAVSLRCTTIFRREQNDWKIVHRHADPITTARPAESVVPA